MEKKRVNYPKRQFFHSQNIDFYQKKKNIQLFANKNYPNRKLIIIYTDRTLSVVETIALD